VLDFLYVFDYGDDHVKEATTCLYKSIESIKKSTKPVNIIVANTSKKDIRDDIVGLEDIFYHYFPMQKKNNISKLINRGVRNFVTSEYFFVSDINTIYTEDYIEKMTKYVEQDLEVSRSRRVIPRDNHKIGIIRRSDFLDLGGYDEKYKSLDFASQDFNTRIGFFKKIKYVEDLGLGVIDFNSKEDVIDESLLLLPTAEKVLALNNKDVRFCDLAVNGDLSTMGVISELEDGWRKLDITQEHLDSRFWGLNNGEETLRLNYNLNKDSVVFDVGSYIGKWTEDIYNRYKCNIFSFEPSQEFYFLGLERFIRNDPMDIKGYLEEPLIDLGLISVYDFKTRIYEFSFNNKYKGKIKTYNIGLYDKTMTSPLYLKEDSSSVHGGDEPTEVIKLVEFMEFVKNNDITKIDLLKLNVEGAEFNILNNIIANGFIDFINDIQVQFHKCYPDAINERIKLRNKLSETHYLTYDYSFVWENWRRRK